MDKKLLDNTALDRVSGGLDESGAITCNNCGRTFQADDTEEDLTMIQVSPGSYSGTFIWKCPGCGKWVDGFGNVIR